MIYEFFYEKIFVFHERAASYVIERKTKIFREKTQSIQKF